MVSITHIITGLNVGGAERALFNLLTNGLEGSFQNHVISLLDEGYYGPLLEAAGIPVTCINMSPGHPTPAAIRRLMVACSRTKSDILQGWMIHGNLAVTFAKRFAQQDAALAWNIRTSIETQQKTKFFTQTLTRTGAWFSKKPDAIIYNARRSQQMYEQKGYHPDNAIFLPNGFDTKKWHPNPSQRQTVRKSLGIPNDAQVIGYVGRVHSDKDLPNLSAAFDILINKHQSAHLVTIGKDIESQMGGEKNVICLGERFDVPDLIQSFDLLCLSSEIEGFPNVIGEAMASGLPCVSTNVGDAKNIIGDTGWIAPIHSPEKLAKCLDQALSCKPEELQQRGQRARERIVEDYSISSVVEKYTSLYHSILKSTL